MAKKKTVHDMSEAIHTLFVGDQYVFGKNGSVTVGFHVQLPDVHTLSGNDFVRPIEDREGQNLLGVLINAIKTLNVGYIFHQQDIFYYDRPNIKNEECSPIQKDVELAFNEREFLNSKTYIFITDPRNNFSDDRNFMETRRNEFNEVLNSFMAAIKFFKPKLMSDQDWVDYFDGMFSCNFDKTIQKPILDIDFENGKLGDMEFVGYATTGDASIEKLQSKLQNEKRSSSDNTMFNSWVYPLCWEVGCFKVINNIIQRVDSEQVKKNLRSFAGKMGFFSQQGEASKGAAEFANIIEENKNAVAVYHNFSAFFAYPQKAAKRCEEEILSAFQKMTFKERKLTINLEQLFLGALGGGNALLSYPDDLYPLFLNEAVCFSNMEASSTQYNKGVVLHTTENRPLLIDFFETPYARGVIQNFNSLCFGPSGSGKSVSTNKLICSYISLDYFAIVLDVGNSYKPMSQFLSDWGNKSRYIEMSSSGEALSFNPFLSLPLVDPNLLEKKEKNDFAEEVEIVVDIIFLAWDPAMKAEEKLNVKNSASVQQMKNQMYDFCRWRFVNKKEYINFDDFFDFLKNRHESSPFSIDKDYFDYSQFALVMFNFTTKGDWGFLFNGNTNFFDITGLNLIVMELEKLQERPALYRITCAMIMVLGRQIIDRAPHVHKILFLDEAWMLLQDPFFGDFIAKLFRTIRKKGAGIGLAIQDFDTLYSHKEFASVIRTNTDTLMLAPHENKKELIKLNQENLGLSNSQLNVALSLSNKHHEIFIKQGNTVSVRRVVLTPLELFLFSTDKNDARKREQYYQENNQNMYQAALAYLDDLETKKKNKNLLSS